MSVRILAAAALLAIGAAPVPYGPQAWLTTGDGKQRLARIVLTRPQSGAVRIAIDPGQRFQTMVGFGAAITDASAILIAGMKPAARARLMHELFGTAPGQLGLGFTRLTIGASDFSPTHYSFDDMPAGQRDPELSHFSIDANRETVLPVVKQALRINQHLVVMASPWSPPGWMKTGDSMIGGTLRADAYAPYAQYFVRYLKAYAAEGVPIRYLTIQNEPDFSPDSYPGMKWPAADRARFVGEHLGPALAEAKIDTGILEWDHNWDQPQQPLTAIANPAAARFIKGVAWHCYGGDVSAQAKVHAAHPDKETFFTECSGGGWRPGWQAGFEDTVRNLMIGSTRNWAKGVLLWNLALDPKAGPHKGGCGNCRGVVTIDPKTGAVTRNLEYYALGHLSRFVVPGAVRIASTNVPGAIETVAFRNPDGTTVLLAYNAGKAARLLSVGMKGPAASLRLPAGSAVTLRM
jgi:glucosylceramidase